jgi:predicted aldo/keto reductase-like oxidoreductase
VQQTRRQFLKLTLAAGAAANLSETLRAGDDAASTDGMPRRTLGRTRESVTILGLGCAYVGRGVSEAETRATIEAAIEGGIRYFDAAPEYEQAEVRLGPVVKPIRDRVFLVTKTYALDAKQAEQDLRQALRQLETDRVDLFLQHAVGIKPIETNGQILGKGGSLEFLRKAKKDGLTRFIGMSVHAPHKVGLHLLDESDEWDVVMPFINYVSDAELKRDGEGDKLLARARRDNLGIVAMKVLGGYPGKLAENCDRAFRYAMSAPGVACVLIGAGNVAQMKRALRAVKEFKPMNETERKETLRIGEEMVRSKSPEAILLQRHTQEDFGSPRFA